jgi:hypothetical protein
MNIRSTVHELLHSHGRTGKHDEGNIGVFVAFRYERVQKY